MPDIRLPGICARRTSIALFVSHAIRFPFEGDSVEEAPPANDTHESGLLPTSSPDRCRPGKAATGAIAGELNQGDAAGPLSGECIATHALRK